MADAPGKKRIRRILENVVLVCASVITTLLLLELGLRVLGFGPSYFSPWAANLWRYDSLLGWTNSEGQKGFLEHPQFKVSVNINSKGLRDIEHDYEKPAELKRILILGDSFVWGFGVEADERFSAIMQQEIDSTKHKVEIINAGVSGWSTDQQLLWLQEYGLKYNPDIVILIFYQNDLEDNLRYMVNNFYRKPRFVRGEGGELILTGTPCPHASKILLAIKYLRNNSSVISLLGNLTYRSGLNPAKLIFGNANSNRNQDEEINLSLDLIRRINDLLAELGIKFILATYCDGDQSCLTLSDLIKRNGIISLNIDHLDGYSKKSMTIKDDGHWNAVGHNFVGKALTEFVGSEKLLK